MTTNAEILRKADMALADLASGGLLNPEQSNTFIRKLITPASLLRQVRLVTMSAPTRNINKIQFASRILKPAVSATALSSGDRSKPTTSQVQLATKEVIAEVRLPYDVIEDNIEGGNLGQHQDAGGSALSGRFRDTIVTLIAERVALDLEELAILGDTGSGDAYLALNDGYIKEIETNGATTDVGGVPIDKPAFKQALKDMPDQYLRSRPDLRFFISVDNEIEYRDALSRRGTGLGDAHTTANLPVPAYGTPVEGVSLMPEAKGIFTNPKNLIFGIQRQIMMEFDKIIAERVYQIVVTARVDFQVEEAEAGIVLQNIA